VTRYWFGLFSHRRATQQWKGMLELPLGSLAEDHEVANLGVPSSEVGLSSSASSNPNEPRTTPVMCNLAS
jgi:hypothetical protein